MNSTIRSALAAATFVLSPVISAAQATLDTTATPISLAEAIRLAQQNAPATVQARGAIKTSDLSVKQAYSAFLPSINLSAGTSRQKGDRFDTQGNLVPFTGNPASYSTGMNANLQLFDGGRRLFDIRKTKADVHAAEATEVTQRYQIALQVKQQYYNILAARESESAAQAQIEQANQQLRAASLRLRAGQLSLPTHLLGYSARQRAAGDAHRPQQSEPRERDATRLVASPRTVTATPSDTSISEW